MRLGPLVRREFHRMRWTSSTTSLADIAVVSRSSLSTRLLDRYETLSTQTIKNTTYLPCIIHVAGKYAPLLSCKLYRFPEFHPPCSDVWQEMVGSRTAWGTLQDMQEFLHMVKLHSRIWSIFFTWSIYTPGYARGSFTWSIYTPGYARGLSHGQSTLQNIPEVLRMVNLHSSICRSFVTWSNKRWHVESTLQDMLEVTLSRYTGASSFSWSVSVIYWRFFFQTLKWWK